MPPTPYLSAQKTTHPRIFSRRETTKIAPGEVRRGERNPGVPIPPHIARRPVGPARTFPHPSRTLRRVGNHEPFPTGCGPDQCHPERPQPKDPRLPPTPYRLAQKTTHPRISSRRATTKIAPGEVRRDERNPGYRSPHIARRPVGPARTFLHRRHPRTPNEQNSTHRPANQ